MTNREKLDFILKKEMEITMAVISKGHQPTNEDKYQKDRELIKKYRIELGIIKPKKDE